jgi:hypothetical protein
VFQIYGYFGNDVPVSQIISNMDVGAEASFFGILKNVNFNKSSIKGIVGVSIY